MFIIKNKIGSSKLNFNRFSKQKLIIKRQNIISNEVYYTKIKLNFSLNI